MSSQSKRRPCVCVCQTSFSPHTAFGSPPVVLYFSALCTTLGFSSSEFAGTSLILFENASTMLTKVLSGSRQWMQNPHVSLRRCGSQPVSASATTRSISSGPSQSLAAKWYSLIPQQAWANETRRTINLPSPSCTLRLHPICRLVLSFDSLSNIVVYFTYFTSFCFSVRTFSVPQIEVQILAPVIPAAKIEVSPEPVMEATSTLRKRKTKMNNHKRRKRLKKQRFLLRKLGKI